MATSLAVEVEVLWGVENTAEKDCKEEEVADDTNGPCPNHSLHSAICGCEAEEVSDDFSPQDWNSSDVEGGVEELIENIHGDGVEGVTLLRSEGCGLL